MNTQSTHINFPINQPVGINALELKIRKLENVSDGVRNTLLGIFQSANEEGTHFSLRKQNIMLRLEGLPNLIKGLSGSQITEELREVLNNVKSLVKEQLISLRSTDQLSIEDAFDDVNDAIEEVLAGGLETTTEG